MGHSPDRCLKYAMSLLARSDRTSHELRKRMRARGFSEQETKKAINKLNSLGAIDDSRAVSRYLERKLNRKPAGKERLLFMLTGKGIPESFARSELEHVSDELLIRKSLCYLKERKIADNYRRVCSFLKSGGFSTEVCERIIRELGYEY